MCVCVLDVFLGGFECGCVCVFVCVGGWVGVRAGRISWWV